MSRPPFLARCMVALLLLLPFAPSARAAQDEEVDEIDVTELVPINEMCPVMPDEPVELEYTVVYQGQAIGLCCSTCRRKFRRDPEKYLALVAEFVPAEGAPPAPGSDQGPAPAEMTPNAEQEPVPAWVKAAGRFHPLLVHFPIALLLAGAFAELVDALRRRSGLRSALRFCLGLGALGGIAAALLGWAASAGVSFPSEDATVFERHRVAGIVTAALGSLAFVLALMVPREPQRTRRRTALRWVLVASVVAVSLAGYLGGELVRGPNHLGF